MITATRYHDISTGHRVFGHESKCSHIHGHNYRIFFTVGANQLDSVGRVVDFSVIKSILCMWIENNWDHKFLIYEHDPIASDLLRIDPRGVVIVPFNPTAENMGQYLVDVIGPRILPTGIELIQCDVEETRKCSVTVSKDK